MDRMPAQDLLVEFSRDLAYPFTSPKIKLGDEGRDRVDMRAEKILLLIGLLSLCALLVLYFVAIEGEKNTVPLTTSTTVKND